MAIMPFLSVFLLVFLTNITKLSGQFIFPDDERLTSTPQNRLSTTSSPQIPNHAAIDTSAIVFSENHLNHLNNRQTQANRYVAYL